MVTEITAYQDSSGKVHGSKLEAVRADAKLRLEKVLGKENQAFITAILQEAMAVWEALDPLTDELARQPKLAEDKEAPRAHIE